MISQKTIVKYLHQKEILERNNKKIILVIF